MTSETDYEVLTRHLAGDEDAFAELVRRHDALVRNYLTRHYLYSYIFTHGPDVLDDLMQETWLRVHRHGARYEPDTSRFTSWVTTIACNLAKNFLRDLGRQRKCMMRMPQAVGTATEKEFADETISANPERMLEQQEDDATLSIDIAILLLDPALTPQQRLVLELRGLIPGSRVHSYDEISQKLGIPEGTVKSALCRAKSVARRIHLRARPVKDT